MIDVFDDYPLFFFLEGIGCILDSARLKKLLTFVLLVSVQTRGASGKFLELIPIVYDFVAACPAFLEVVENGFSGVVVASSLYVFIIFVVFETSVPFASLFSLIAHYIIIIQNILNLHVNIISNI